jgi:hypothetical protein
MAVDIVSTVLSAAVANGGTITFSYPAGKDAGSYRGGYNHSLIARGLQSRFTEPANFTIAFGSSVVVTYNGSTTIPAGTHVSLELNTVGMSGVVEPIANTTQRLSKMELFHVDFGAVDTADADGVIASQAITSASGPATGINGALASGGVATFDVPRNVVAAWTNTAVMTVTGTDEYGVTVKESSASGTSFTGKKAFKTVTAVSVSADVTGATVGSGVVLGLPVYIPYAAGSVVKEVQDGANASAGTVVAGVRTAATATTGDVRGTWAPNGTPNGTINFAITLCIDNPNYRGVTQFS